MLRFLRPSKHMAGPFHSAGAPCHLRWGFWQPLAELDEACQRCFKDALCCIHAQFEGRLHLNFVFFVRLNPGVGSMRRPLRGRFFHGFNSKDKQLRQKSGKQ